MIKLITEEVFKETQGMSYSRLSKLADSPQAYKASLAEGKESSAMSLGSMVDIMLTDPDSLYKKIYVMSTLKPSSDLMLKFVETYLETNDIDTAHTASGFKISADAVMIKFEKEGRAYYNAVKAAGDKTIIDISQLMIATQLVDQLKSNPYTKGYFIPEADEIELFFQVPIVWNMKLKLLPDRKNFEDIKMKSMIDIVKINHKEKTVQITDLKTGGESFWKGYYRYKRYLQAGMYFDGFVNTLIQENNKELLKYTIIPTNFIFADTTLRFPPVIYTSTQNDINVGVKGRSYVSLRDIDIDKIKYKGYIQLAEELLWHQKNDLWDYPYEVYQNNGEIDIDAFTIKF